MNLDGEYTERLEPMTVTITEWNPRKGRTHKAVAGEKRGDGSYVGTLARPDGANITGIEEGWYIITYPVKPPVYAVITPAQIPFHFERAVTRGPRLSPKNEQEWPGPGDAFWSQI